MTDIQENHASEAIAERDHEASKTVQKQADAK